MDFFRKKPLKSLALIAIFATMGLASCGGGSSDSNPPSDSGEVTTSSDEQKEVKYLEFADSLVTAKVDEESLISFSTNCDIGDLKVEMTTSSDFEHRLTAEGVYVTFHSVGTGILTVSSSMDGVACSTYISVVEDSSQEVEYRLVLDASGVKNEYLLGENFDPSNLKVSAEKYVDGVKQDGIIYDGNYTLSLTEDDAFEELGIHTITVTSAYFGSASFDVEVKQSISSTELQLDTSAMGRSVRYFTKGSVFSRSGLKATLITNTRSRASLEDEVVYSSSSTEVTDFTTSIAPNTVLDSNGWIDVVVTSGDASASYEIIVYEDDDTFKDVAFDYVNTKNIGVEVFSNVPFAGYELGFNRSITFKNQYYLVKDYAKSSLDDDSKETVSSSYGVLKDGNSRLVKYSLSESVLTATHLLKSGLTRSQSYWDYSAYLDVSTFKSFNVSDFPIMRTSDEGPIAYQKVVPFEYNDDYATSMSYYPLVESAFKVAGIDNYYFRFVDAYEVDARDEKISIKVYFDEYGYVEVSTILQEDNADNAAAVAGLTDTSFTFSSEVPADILSVKAAVNRNNYVRTISSSYGSYYFNENYIVYGYNPLNANLILSGIQPFGLVKVKDSSKGFADGIYRVYGTASGPTSFSLTTTEGYEPAIVYEDTASLSYTDEFAAYASAYTTSYQNTFGIPTTYLSTILNGFFNDDTLMASMEPAAGTSNFYVATNIDASLEIMKVISVSSSSMEEAGYVNGAMVPSFDDAGDLETLYVYATDKNLYGYGCSYSNFGEVNFAEIDDYFGI